MSDEERRWDEQASIAKKNRPLKRLTVLPNIPGIAPKERKHLLWKGFKYMLLQKEGGQNIGSYM